MRSIIFVRRHAYALALAITLSSGTATKVMAEELYVSFRDSGTKGGVSFDKKDILKVVLDEHANESWSMVFDGSMVGAGNLDDFEMLEDGSILLSFAADASVIGAAPNTNQLSNVDGADIVRFIPSTAGNYSQGEFQVVLDGSDVAAGNGPNGDENIRALAISAEGEGIIATFTGALDVQSQHLTVTGGPLIVGAVNMAIFLPVRLGDTSLGLWDKFDSFNMPTLLQAASVSAAGALYGAFNDDNVVLGQATGSNALDKDEIFHCQSANDAASCKLYLDTGFAIGGVSYGKRGMATLAAALTNTTEGLNERVYVSPVTKYSLDNFTCEKGDICKYNGLDISWNRVFSAGALGLRACTDSTCESASTNVPLISAFHVVENPEQEIDALLLVFDVPGINLPGMQGEIATRYDVVNYNPSTGLFALYFSGSDYGMTAGNGGGSSGEQIASLAMDQDGLMLFAAQEGYSDLMGNNFSPNDIVRFDPADAVPMTEYITFVAGTDVRGLAFQADENGNLMAYINTEEVFHFDDKYLYEMDIFSCSALAAGGCIADSYAEVWRGQDHGIFEQLKGMHYVKSTASPAEPPVEEPGAGECLPPAIAEGSDILYVSPPETVVPNRGTESNEYMFFFREKTGHVVAASDKLTVDANSVGVYKGNEKDSIAIAVGTEVDSYFIHFDPLSGSHTFSGTVILPERILGVIYSYNNLKSSDLSMGYGPTQYPAEMQGSFLDRDLEKHNDTADIVQIIDDYTVKVNLLTGSSSDQVRIITEAQLACVPE